MLPSQRQKTPALPPVSKSSFSAGPELSQAASSNTAHHAAAIVPNRIIVVELCRIGRDRGGGREEGDRSGSRSRKQCAHSASGPYPAGVNPSFRAESRSSDFSFCDAFPIEISGLNVSRSTSVARDGCRNLQQRELFGSCTRFPFHPGAARLRRAVGTLGEAKIRRIFQKAAFYGKIAAISRKDRRRRVADRAVGTGFRHSARCQPVVPRCSGQPPS